jgi:FkbM family methyltransferase
MKRSLFLIFLFTISSLYGENYEGISLFRSYGKVDLEWLPQFLPYNPIIVEAGALYGGETLRAAQIWPQGRIFAFEPNPPAFFKLREQVKRSKQQNIELFNLALAHFNGPAPFYICYGMKGEDAVFEYASSLLPTTAEMQIYCKGPCVDVSCVILDDWCRLQNIDHIDLLHLELEGLELTVLQNSPDILKTVKVVYVKTFNHPYRAGMTQYHDLKAFLEKSNFVLLSHWYQTGITGHAIFLNREIFDAYFKLSLGIYLEV